METDSDDRIRERNAKISRNYGTMLVRDLRERYGENFAAGHADTATLREVINRLDAASSDRLQGDLEQVQLDEAFRPGPSGGLIDTRQDAPAGPAIKFPSISRSALAASLGSSGCLSSGAGLNFSTICEPPCLANTPLFESFHRTRRQRQPRRREPAALPSGVPPGS